MEIKIEGNPGTGNTFQEIHIGNVENYNPNATTVINNKYGVRDDKPASTGLTPDRTESEAKRKEILEYVSKLVIFLTDEWKSRYAKVWNDILDLDVVRASVYYRGKQQDTNFNRDLVAGITFYLAQKGAFKTPYNASQMAGVLEGNPDSSVRGSLRQLPPKDIKSRLDRYFE